MAPGAEATVAAFRKVAAKGNAAVVAVARDSGAVWANAVGAWLAIEQKTPMLAWCKAQGA